MATPPFAARMFPYTARHGYGRHALTRTPGVIPAPALRHFANFLMYAGTSVAAGCLGQVPKSTGRDWHPE